MANKRRSNYSRRSSNGKYRGKRKTKHNDPRTTRSREDQARRDHVRDTEFEVRIVDDELPELKYPSLERGLLLLPNGSEFIDHAFYDEFVENNNEKLSFYVKTGDKGNGKTGIMTRPVANPVQKETVTLSGEHDTVLKALDQSGIDVLPFVMRTALFLANNWTMFDRRSRCLAIAVHPEAGCLHFHPETTHISDDNRLIDPHTHQGNNRTPHLKIDAIAALRLKASGLNSEKEAKWAIKRLAKIENKHGSLPPDYLVSMWVDREVEKAIRKLLEVNPDLAPIVHNARMAYRENFEINRERRNLIAAVEEDEFVTTANLKAFMAVAQRVRDQQRNKKGKATRPSITLEDINHFFAPVFRNMEDENEKRRKRMRSLLDQIQNSKRSQALQLESERPLSQKGEPKKKTKEQISQQPRKNGESVFEEKKPDRKRMPKSTPNRKPLPPRDRAQEEGPEI